MKMKKKILTAAIALAAICGLSASAQKPACVPGAACPETAQQCRKGSPDCDKPCGGPYCEVFAGLNLTDSQKAAIQQLNKDRRANRQQCDSTRRAARKQARRDYIQGVKKVLTPEQYVQFLETIVVEQPAGAARFANRAGKAMRKADGKHRMHARHDKRDLGKANAVKADGKYKAEKGARLDKAAKADKK